MKYCQLPAIAAMAVSMGLCQVSSAAIVPDFDLDPHSFRREADGTFSAFGTALCAAPSPQSETLVVRARIRPDRCDDPDWAALGVNAYLSPNDYWQLALVKTPDKSGSKRNFELKAMANSIWGAEKDFATRVERKKFAAWEYGREYDFALVCSPGRVEGEVRDAETGKTVFREAYAIPAAASLPWRPALYVNGQLHGAFSAVEVEGVDSSAPGEAVFSPPYRPSGPETGIRGKATGFFHVETIDGRDWPIDPTGRAVILAATQHIKPQGTHSDALGYSPYGRFVATNYPSVEAWVDETLERLSDWGFTMIGNACPLGLFAHKTLPHVRNIQLGQRVCRGDPEWFIREWEYAPCTALPNVFHPQFAEACEWRAREMCAPSKDDPWLVGWFIDNELAWWGNRWSMPATGLFDAVAALPRTHSARQELERWLRERHGKASRADAEAQSEFGLSTNSKCPRLSTDQNEKLRVSAPLREIKDATFDDKTAFLRHYARTYYEKTVAAIRKADPNHMVMGSRYAGIAGAHPVVFEEAGRQCDIVTFNMYPWADLDRGIVLDEMDGVPMTERFREYHGYAKKPLMVTEWSFPAIDNGHPCLVGAGQRLNTQAERVEATTLFARTMLADPHVVGYDYFKWNDQPREGASRWSPEDCNYGLVDDENRPYEGIVGAFKALHENLVEWRYAPPPKERAVGPDAMDLPSESELFFMEAAAGAGSPAGPDKSGLPAQEKLSPAPVVFAQSPDGAWSLSNGLVRFSGRVGSRWLADEVAFARPVGRWGALLACRDGGTNIWVDISRLVGVSFERDEATGAVSATLRGEGATPSGPFAIEQRLTLAPHLDHALAEITAFENLSEKPVELRALFMRPFPLDAKPEPAVTTPKLWKAPQRAAWKLPGGGTWLVSSADRSAAEFRFWVQKNNGAVHPDASFSAAGANATVAVPPGATWVPPSPMGASIALGD